MNTWYNSQCLSEQNTGALYLNAVQLDIVNKVPSAHGLTSSVVRLDNGNMRGGYHIMPDSTYIYALVDPRTNEIRYIGKSNDIRRRLRGHLEVIDRYNTPTTSWLKQLRNLGLIPEIRILEEVPIQIWEDKERWWIASFRERNINLTNVGRGGEGGNGSANPEETRRRMSAAQKGRKKPPRSNEAREHYRQAQLGKKQSQETISKRIAKVKGRKHSAEWSANISKGRMGIKLTMEQRRTISENNGGSKLTPDQVRRIRELIKEKVRKEEIAQYYGVNVSTIYHISSGKTYRFVE
jgi:group I intron endonuclease